MSSVKRIENPFNKNDIFETLDMLQISQRGMQIQTHFGGNLISDTEVSGKYEIFNFPDFAKEVVGQVQNYFTPEKYQLRIAKGQQELRLIGEDVVVNGEQYSKMFNILNSSDKSRALQLNIGLIRFVCTNGMVIGVENEHAAMKTRHFKATLPGKVEEFVANLEDFDLCINKQTQHIESLSGRFITFKGISERIALDEDRRIKNGTINRLKAFGNKLINSQSDRINILGAEQIALLKNPHLFLNSEFNNVDVEMSAYQALNCWTEVYRSYDSSVLKRETTRILELV